MTLRHLLANFSGLRNHHSTFCVYGRCDFDDADLETKCYIDAYPQITEDFDEIYPSYVVQNGLALWCREELLEGVIFNVFSQYPSAPYEIVLSAAKYYMKNDAFMEIERLPKSAN